MRIGCVSDVCLGYGSPQIPLLIGSLAEHYGADAFVVEPDRPEVAACHERFPGLNIQRATNAFPPYTEAGRVDYILRAAEIIDRYAPDVLVVCCTYSLPVLFKIRRRPRFVIYQSLESIPGYGSFDTEMNRHIEGMVDLIIFPEENRAARDTVRCGFQGIPKVLLYNCPVAANGVPGWAPARNGRILSCGTIHRERTYAEYYTRPEMQSLPIDLYGPIEADSEDDRRKFLAALPGQIRYQGYVDGGQLTAIRKAYAYSIVIWNPSNENQLYAAPNKLFESIADGVPPIAAPHPQCKMLIERYGCGLLMPNWSFEAFQSTLAEALRIYNTDRWREMVSNCERAIHQELNWNCQFEKLKTHLMRVN
jgi:hypothetical protein